MPSKRYKFTVELKRDGDEIVINVRGITPDRYIGNLLKYLEHIECNKGLAECHNLDISIPDGDEGLDKVVKEYKEDSQGRRIMEMVMNGW